MRVLDLFSGIGGFALGLERAGFTTVAFCEVDPFCRAVLAKHWPEVPIYDDVRALTGARLAADGIVCDAICGGFPCQDISVAGRGAGLAGDRSGLWFEYLRVVSEVAPRWVIIENVPALRSRGLDTVLGGLSALGYDAEWHCIPAAALGAPHRRDRVWIVANSHEQAGRRFGDGWRQQQPEGSTEARHVAHAPPGGRREHGHVSGEAGNAGAGQPAVCGEAMAHPEHSGRQGWQSPGPIIGPDAIVPSGWRRSESRLGREIDGTAGRVDRHWPTPHGASGGGKDGAYDGHGNELAQAVYVSVGTSDSARSARKVGSREVEPWEGNTPRTIGRGAPNRRPRLKAIGNSVVPQVVELIGRAILRREAIDADDCHAA